MRLLQVALLVPTIIFGAVPAIAQSQPCGTSYIILPNGKCVDLTYTTVLAGSRGNAQAARQDYQELFEANVTLEGSREYKRNETKEERESRYGVLANKKQGTEKIEANTQKIEDLAYPLHRRAMTEVEKAFGWSQ